MRMKKGRMGPKVGEGAKSERPMLSRIFGLNGPVLLNSTSINSGATWKTAGRRKWHAPHYVEKNRQTCTHAALNKYINTGMEASKFDYLPSNTSVREKALSEEQMKVVKGGGGC